MHNDISPCFQFIYKALGTGLVGVEIGIWDGGNAKTVLNYIFPEKYYMIDPYIASEEYKGPQFSQDNFDKTYNDMYSLFSKLPNTVILKMTSIEASKIVENELDFVYIDGSHYYKNKIEDLNAWYPKIRSGGILCGDDYNVPDVEKAVLEFGKNNNIKFEISSNSLPHPTEYWYIKE